MGDLLDIVRVAAARRDVRDAVARVYADVAAVIDDRRPRCDASGRCCRFEQFGHRLYVSTLELAKFLADLPAGWAANAWDGAGCPFQTADGLCGLHAARPFGCWMFFCDPTSTDWQNAAYERFHGELKQLHETLGVPYRYVEWRSALAALGLAVRGEGRNGATSLVVLPTGLTD